MTFKFQHNPRAEITIRYFLILLLFYFLLPGSSALAIGGYEPYLEKVELRNDSIITGPGEREIKIGYRYNDLTFVFNISDSTKLRFLLEGYDDGWSDWYSTTIKEYTNLPAGKYILRAQYIYDGSNAGELTAMTFRILPLWYFSGPAIAFYLLLVTVIVWASYTSLNLRFARTQYMLEQIINKRTEDLIIEKEKSDKLLANVLPKNTATEIMEKGKATKMKYNFVTVLFSDIQGFTKIAEETNPEVLIDELDKFFFHFDSVVERLGIEKIKTIGDAYMCAGGIPEKNRTNPVEVVLAALEMQVYMLKLKRTTELEGMKFWDIRIGIHTGTVIAGVVGQKKLSYDIWGDTVNTASRMESSGEAGKINISGTTYEFVKDFFLCTHRGRMPVKYKGDLDMYFVEGIRPELLDSNGEPNDIFRIRMQMIRVQDIEDTILKMFDNEAPPDLYFHNSQQVRGLCSQADLLSNAESITEAEFIYVKLAAVFLYSGYLTTYVEPWKASGELAANTMVKFGFLEEDIEKVIRLIDNSYNGVYESNSDRVLHDARFDYTGRIDYVKLSERLLKEQSEYGHSKTKDEWIAIQKQMLKEHDFLTNSARMLRSISIDDQIQALNQFYEVV